MAWYECMSHYVIVHTGGVYIPLHVTLWHVWYPCIGVTQCYGTDAYVTHDGMISMHMSHKMALYQCMPNYDMAQSM